MFCTCCLQFKIFNYQEKYTAFDEIFLLGKNSYDNFGGFDSVHKASSNLKLHTEDGHVKLIGTNFNYYKYISDL